MTEAEVVVVGAGPTGLTLACALRLHGIDVRVLDAAPGPATTSRANFVHARGSEVLDRIGALGSLPDESLRAMRITSHLGDRPMMTLEFGDPGMRTAAPPMVVSQARVEASLRARLTELGTVAQWNHRLLGVDQDADGVTAALDDGRRLRCRFLVGCDGTSSATRTAVGIGFPGVKLTERFLLADLHLDWDVDRSGTAGWVHPSGILGAMPMPDDTGREDLWRILAYDPEFTGRAGDEAILERLREIIPERSGRTVEIGDAEWLSVFTVHRRLADTYRRGRVLIAGDAAHAHAPFGGQGMLTGIGDAENLGFKLALVLRGHASERLLDTYEAERRPLATDVLRGTSAVTRMNVAHNPVGRLLRDRVAPLIFRRGWVQRWTTYSTSQLWVSYRKGPLGGRGRRPRPGDRIADRPCRRTDGTDTRLYRELGGHWALVTPTGEVPLIAWGVRRLGQYCVVLTHRDQQVMLVRPDGHLAWRGGVDDVDELSRWTATVLNTGRGR